MRKFSKILVCIVILSCFILSNRCNAEGINYVTEINAFYTATQRPTDEATFLTKLVVDWCKENNASLSSNGYILYNNEQITASDVLTKIQSELSDSIYGDYYANIAAELNTIMQEAGIQEESENQQAFNDNVITTLIESGTSVIEVEEENTNKGDEENTDQTTETNYALLIHYLVQQARPEEDISNGTITDEQQQEETAILATIVLQWCTDNNATVNGEYIVYNNGNGQTTAVAVLTEIYDQLVNSIFETDTNAAGALYAMMQYTGIQEGGENQQSFNTYIINTLANEQGIHVETETNEFVDIENTTVIEEIVENPVTIIDTILAGVDGLAGIVLYPIRILIVAGGTIFNSIITGIASIGGNTNGMVSIEDIIFTTGNAANGVELVALNFFDFSSEYASPEIIQIRQSIATWFYLLRNLSIVISLCVLIYTGIRMAISTIASERLKYKTMLMNWVVQMILIFLMQYIVFSTIGINNAIVNTLTPVLGEEGNQEVSNYITQLGNMAGELFSNFTISFGAAILYLILLGYTFAFLIMYIKRMLTVGFLILISPLVTVTYAIDKMGDSKSQALNTWLKEFVYNILIQPFHCILFLAFAGNALELLTKEGGVNLGNAVVAVICIMFMFKAEDILKKIFAFDKNAKSLGSGIATATAMGAGIGMISNMLKKQNSTNNANKDEPLPDLSAIYQNQNVAAQTAKNLESTQEPVSKTQSATGTRSIKEIEEARRRNRKKEAWRESGGVAGMAMRFGVAQAKMTLPIMTAFIAGGQGNLGKMVTAGLAGATAGQAIEDRIVEKIQQKERLTPQEISRQAKTNEKVFEQIQKEQERKWMQKEGKWENYTKEDIINEQRRLLAQNIDDIEDEEEKKYAIILQTLSKTYEKLGYNNPDGEVMNFTRNIPRS